MDGGGTLVGGGPTASVAEALRWTGFDADGLRAGCGVSTASQSQLEETADGSPGVALEASGGKSAKASQSSLSVADWASGQAVIGLGDFSLSPFSS